MARKFEFNKRNELELDIAGEKFTVNVMDPNWLKKHEAKRVKIEEMGQRLRKLGENEAANVNELDKLMEEAIILCAETIDVLLGEKATERIFKDREIKFLDIVDVVHFIFNEASEHLERDVINKYSPNRAQRRARK